MIDMKIDFKALETGFDSLVLLKKAAEIPVLNKFYEFVKSVAGQENDSAKTRAYCEFVSCLYQHGADFGKAVLETLENDDNVYIRMSAKGEEIPVSMKAAFASELDFLSMLTELEASQLLVSAGLPHTLAHFENTYMDFVCVISERLKNASKYGYGMFAKYGMFRVSDKGDLVPVLSPDSIQISELVGYDEERKEVIDNTRAFLEGKPAANVLLCGDAGTGKSSTVKACANMFKKDGLRLIELRKDQLKLLPEVMGEIADNPLHFILFVDDLSFACDDDGFGSLKAALEGSCSARADNAVIYATSNRRHLVKETFSSRAGDEVHRRDTIEELTSLSERFGISVLFSKPNKDLYLQIVKSLVQGYEIEIDEKELAIKAEAFALAKGGRSARVAGQFADSLVREMK